MTWAALIPILIQYGLPFVDGLIQRLESNSTITLADWQALKALANQSARTQMLAALQRAGIDPNSAQGQQMLGLVPGDTPPQAS